LRPWIHDDMLASTTQAPAAPHTIGKAGFAVTDLPVVTDLPDVMLSFASKALVIGNTAPEPVCNEEFVVGFESALTPASDGRCSPSFSRPNVEPPTLHRTAAEIDGVASLLGLPHPPESQIPPPGKFADAQMPTLQRTASEMAGIHSLMGLATTPAKRSSPAAPQSPPPKRLCSDASVEQLKVCAAAFRLCPNPTHEQMEGIAMRAQLTSMRVAAWFRNRRALQAWVLEQRRAHPTTPVAELVSSTWSRAMMAHMGA